MGSSVEHTVLLTSMNPSTNKIPDITRIAVKYFTGSFAGADGIASIDGA